MGQALAASRKYVDDTWDFRKANTKQLTHCFHSYPAMMIPQIAGKLLDSYGKKARSLFDPYCGTGTSLVEGTIRNISVVGTDLNPLCRLISESKITPISVDLLDEQIELFMDMAFRLRFQGSEGKAAKHDFKNIDYWFDKNVQEQLNHIRQYIAGINEKAVANFFKVAFSETVREASWTRNGEFKLYRMTEAQIDRHSVDCYDLMNQKLRRNRDGLVSYMFGLEGNPSRLVSDFDTVVEIPKEYVPEASIDIVVTSPPYGDSRTTVAYGQFSRLSNEWLGYANAAQIDSLLMGGKRKGENNALVSSPHLGWTIEQILKNDTKRAQEVVAFFNDYQRSIANVASRIRLGGYACYVVGNRRVKGVTIETDEITRSFFEDNGFTHIETIVRNIPNKRMPSRNSPSNVTGKTDTTMKNEYIVVMQKTKCRPQ